MKKLFVTLLVAMAMTTPVLAQVSFGFKGGLNLTKMTFDRSELEEAISNKSGFFFGPTVKFTLPIAGMGMDAAVFYDQREGEIKGVGEKLKQKSIQIPVNMRYSFGMGGFGSFFLFAGPQFGFSVSGDDKLNIRDWSLRNAHISGNAGLGVLIVSHLQLSVGYNFALSKSAKYKVYEEDGGTRVEKEADVKNNAWQIALAYYF